MENFIIIAILVVVIGLAAAYVYKVKRKGDKCIGCPHCNSCSTKQKIDCNLFEK